jgi:hypothetical protein
VVFMNTNDLNSCGPAFRQLHDQCFLFISDLKVKRMSHYCECGKTFSLQSNLTRHQRTKGHEERMSRQKWLMLIERIERIRHLVIGAGGEALTLNDVMTGK